MEWADRCWREHPRYTLALRIRLVCCAYLGRIEEARTDVRRLLEIYPKSTITRWTANTTGYYPAEIFAVFEEGYRKAGLPEE